jgi:acetyl esterase
MSLHPQVETFLAELKSARPKPTELCTPEEIRARVCAGHCASGEPEPVGRSDDRQIPGIDSEIPIRIYHPIEKQSRGALVFYHGGGWVAGDLDTHDTVCRAICNEAGALVVAVDYRRAPEHTYPAAADDAYAALVWLRSAADEYDIDPNRIAVGGDSAGGNLATVVGLMARDRNEPLPCFQVLVYPVTDYRFDGDSYCQYAEGYGLTAAGMQAMWKHYLGSESRAVEPYVSPLCAETLSGLPPALVMTAKYDVLFDEGERYAERLIEDGVATECICHDDMIHGFLARLHTFDAARIAVRQIAASLRRAFET